MNRSRIFWFGATSAMLLLAFALTGCQRKPRSSRDESMAVTSDLFDAWTHFNAFVKMNGRRPNSMDELRTALSVALVNYDLAKPQGSPTPVDVVIIARKPIPDPLNAGIKPPPFRITDRRLLVRFAYRADGSQIAMSEQEAESLRLP